MALPTFTAGATLPASDLTEIINYLQGQSGKTEAWHFRVSSGNNYLITLADAAGAQKFSVRDSAGVEQFSIDSDGNATIAGTFAPGTLILPASTTPSQTAEGSMKWDSDDDLPTFGTGAATKYIGLSRGAGLDATATKELVFDTTASQFKIWDGSASKIVGGVYKVKSATQVFTTNTTLADVTASSGTFSFAIAASEVWLAEYWIPLSFGGTGGFKAQITGPAAPTLVDITGTYGQYGTTDSISTVGTFTAVSAFSTNVNAANSATGGANVYCTSAPSFIHIFARITNGANAGTVTLQAAQNSSNLTTTLGIGSWMRAVRIG